MGKIESTKVIRVWILGASIFATLFLALSVYYDFWAMKVYNNQQNGDNTTYFGLWKKCFMHSAKNKNGGLLYSTLKCEKYGEGNLANIVGTPNFIKATRGFLIMMAAVMLISTLMSFVLITCSKRPFMYFTGLPTLAGAVIGIIILGIFLAKLRNDEVYDHYVAAWTFYYFVIGWLFSLSAFCASLADRKREYY